MHLFCFFQLLPCFVLLFYHSGLIIICNTVIFPVLEQGILSKKERQTNKKKICFSTCDGFPLDELCRYDWTELFIEPYLVSLSFLHISFSPTLQSVYHLAMGLDYLFLKSLPEGFPIHTPKLAKRQLMNWLTQGQFAVESSCDTRNLNELSLLRWKCQTKSKYLRHLENGLWQGLKMLLKPL